MINQGETIEIKYVRIESKDNNMFYLPAFVACKSASIKRAIAQFKLTNFTEVVYNMKLNYEKKVLNEICDYLNYKYYNEEVSKEKPEAFDISNDFYALQILLCCKELEI